MLHQTTTRYVRCLKLFVDTCCLRGISPHSASPSCLFGFLRAASPAYEQVKEVRGQDVVCTAVNDAMLDGLLTVIHSEQGGDGMSSLQASAPFCPVISTPAARPSSVVTLNGRKNGGNCHVLYMSVESADICVNDAAD